jgi:hypothetical protein
MSLHNGVDTVAWVSLGLLTEGYGPSQQNNINTLFVSLGLIESTAYSKFFRWPNIWGYPWRKIWKSWG